jgi:diguanylate cyclase (GGDEF)-like protein
MDLIDSFGASRYDIHDLELFRDAVTPAVTRALAPCKVVRLAQGEQLQDSVRAHLYIVLSGALGVATETAMGDATIERIAPGASVGEQSVLDDAANLDTMTALEDTELLVIDADLLWQLIDEHNGIARNLLRLLSFGIRKANAMLRRRQKLGEFYRQLSLNDGLTGLYNRAWLADMLPKLVMRARKDTTPLSLVMIDLDHFKRFNDTHGHILGDHALVTAAGVIKDALRPSDFAVRYGGEEMMAILPNTGAQAALLVAERLCGRLRDATVFTDMRIPLPHVTGSFGLATLHPEQDELALIAAADAALYRAKQAGRNRICS